MSNPIENKKISERKVDSQKKWPPVDLGKVDDKFKCSECNDLFFNVHQADDCGCRYCEECLNKIFNRGEKSCPSCKQEFASTQKIPDKYFQKKLLNLSVKCWSPNCEWSGKLSEYSEHFATHSASKPRNCQYCHQILQNKEEHDKHLDIENGDCKKQLIDCVYKSIGCNIISLNDSKLKINDFDGEMMDTSKTILSKSGIPREMMDEHMKECVSYHLELVNKKTCYEAKQLNQRIDQMTSMIQNMPKISETSIRQTYDSGIGSSTYSNAQSNNFQKASSNYTPNLPFSNVEDSRFYDSTSISKMNQDVGDKNSSTLTKELETLNTKLNTLENNQRGLISDITRTIKAYEKLKQENQQYKENIKEYRSICQELHRTLALTQVSLLTLEERLINQEKLSYNGTLLWKITNVEERIQEAKSGRQTSFYSPPFYTDRNGFKMCARIYLNGDGNGRNTHLSLFFVILRGENDALLRWPFRQKVTFILIDQSLSESRENVYDAFRPDPNSSSFRRPVSEMNIASGLPVFCPLGKLRSTDHEYIKDNTMFIKIIVDTKDLPEI